MSLKVSSSGTAPAGVVYVARPDGLVNVCGASNAIAPLADAPVNVSALSVSANDFSSPKSRRAATVALTSFTRSSLSP